MSRYIDADLLKQSIPDTKMDEFENCRYCRLLDEEQVKDLIDQQPTADVVAVVRCKDCKYHVEFPSKCNKLHLTMLPNDYCSYGERAEA